MMYQDYASFLFLGMDAFYNIVELLLVLYYTSIVT